MRCSQARGGECGAGLRSGVGDVRSSGSRLVPERGAWVGQVRAPSRAQGLALGWAHEALRVRLSPRARARGGDVGQGAGLRGVRWAYTGNGWPGPSSNSVV